MALPPERFDYGSWVGAKWKDAQDLSCGTTACALGWAATLPSCRQEGLRLGRDRFGDGTVHLEGEDPRKGGTGSIAAACKVFGIDEEEAEFLFMPSTGLGDEEDHPLSPDQNAGAARVAAHIRRFVEART